MGSHCYLFYSLTGGGFGSGAGGVGCVAAFRCRFSSFFCFFNKSRWRLANE
jgi:hypothetical protein